MSASLQDPDARSAASRLQSGCAQTRGFAPLLVGKPPTVPAGPLRPPSRRRRTSASSRTASRPLPTKSVQASTFAAPSCGRSARGARSGITTPPKRCEISSIGARHGHGLPAQLDESWFVPRGKMNAADRQLSDAMMEYWVRFAQTGDPKWREPASVACPWRHKRSLHRVWGCDHS